MARNIGANLQAAFENDVLRPFYAVHITLPNTQGAGEVTHKLWTLEHSRTYYHDGGSHVYEGLGNFLSVSDISETSDLGASGLKISLVANPTFLTVLRDLEYQGGKVIAWLGAHTVAASGNSFQPAGLFKFFEGFADQMHFSMSENSCIVTLTAENKLIRLSKSSNRYYTHEDQTTEYPNDKGLEFVNAIQEQEVLWGRT